MAARDWRDRRNGYGQTPRASCRMIGLFKPSASSFQVHVKAIRERRDCSDPSCERAHRAKVNGENSAGPRTHSPEPLAQSQVRCFPSPVSEAMQACAHRCHAVAGCSLRKAPAGDLPRRSASRTYFVQGLTSSPPMADIGQAAHSNRRPCVHVRPKTPYPLRGMA
ncbi:hypothetical protein BD413DRAFT_519832 [Trametes elegans]|nr:hypothetical protein BD413DRAFT_519832 [Trametes elegans]